MPIRVGASGWKSRPWGVVLSPPGVPQRRWLEHYASQYATVENDGTFYRLPPERTFADWRQRTPGDFVMAIKASRYLTHVRRLASPAEPVTRLMSAAAGLGPRLGPVLLQLPPTMSADPARLAACLDAFAYAADRTGQRVRVAVEPRHPSWWTPQVHDVLASRNAALCWADRRGRPVTPLWRTADWGYVRFHQGAAAPWPRYGRRALASWLERISAAWPGNAPVYAYFNNDPHGCAPRDARLFARLAGRAGLAPTRVPTAPVRLTAAP